MRIGSIFLMLSLLIFVCSCERPKNESVREQKYFFHWDNQAQVGKCLNSDGVEGYNPRFIGPCGDLRGYQIKYGALDGVDLRGAILDGMNFKGFSLNGANLTAVKARGTVFNEAQLNGAKLMYGHFEGAKFEKTQMNGANLHNGQFSGSTLDKASIFGADLTKSDLSGSKLSGYLDTVKLKGSVFSYGTLLPFDDKMAASRGMKYSNQHNLDIAQALKEEESIMDEEDRMPSSLTEEAEASKAVKKEKIIPLPKKEVKSQ